MSVSLIVAIAENRGIGKNNDLLWHLPADMAYFVQKTSGNPVIMGRKNYLSIPEKYRPLKNRTNIVVTRDKTFSEPGIIVCHSIEDAINTALTENKEVFVIGGGQVYDYVLSHNLVDKLYITEVKANFDADVFFPKLDKTVWVETSRKTYDSDEKNPYSYAFVEYLRQ